MKRLLAALVCAVLFASTSASANGITVQKLHWITSAAATVGSITDSTSFSETGAANATRDTSNNIDITGINPSWFLTPAGDSTLYIRFFVHPVAGSALGHGGDSLYSYVEGVSADGSTMSGVLTNLTEVLSLEQGNTENFTWKITGARALLLAGFPAIRLIVRGDVNGQYEGEVSFHSDENRYNR